MTSPERVIIAALAQENRVIGNRGQIPWHLPTDLKRFRRLTLGHPVVMGRVTWEASLGGRALPQRWNVVVSTSLAPDDLPTPEDETLITVVRSLPEAWDLVGDRPRVFIIGGASIYDQTLNLADRLELTLVEGEFEGDAFFPSYQDLISEQFKQVSVERHPGFRFETYQRR